MDENYAEEIFKEEIDDDLAYDNWRDSEIESASEELRDLITKITLRTGYYHDNRQKLMKHFLVDLQNNLK